MTHESQDTDVTSSLGNNRDDQVSRCRCSGLATCAEFDTAERNDQTEQVELAVQDVRLRKDESRKSVAAAVTSSSVASVGLRFRTSVQWVANLPRWSR
jgi:hypothetical protein